MTPPDAVTHADALQASADLLDAAIDELRGLCLDGDFQQALGLHDAMRSHIVECRDLDILSKTAEGHIGA